jgi:phosphinothricin acetyltransferase
VTTRLAQTSDAEAIAAIYNLEVETTTLTFDLEPRSIDEQLAWQERHTGAHPAIVAISEESGALLGFGALSPYRSRPAYATTVENSVYVARESRGLGVGREILEELIRLAQEHGFHAMIARVVGVNEASIALHQACGFSLVGTEHEVGRKHGKWLDVVELQKML